MKKIFLLLVMTIPVLFTACDNDDGDFDQDAIIGTWKLSDIDSRGSILGIETGVINLGGYFGISTGTSITFNENNTFTDNMLGSILDTSTGEYSISGNKLTLNTISSSSSIDIKSLTNEKLELKIDVTGLVSNVADIFTSPVVSLIGAEVYIVLTCSKI